MFKALLALEARDGDCFVAPAAPERAGRLYGGQLLAQALAAAQRTVGEDRDVHSLHAYFLRPGDVDHGSDIEVERVRDGRSFSTRSVRSLQHGKELFRMLVSFHVSEQGDAFAGHAMPDVPPPEDVTLTYDAFSRAQGVADDWDGGVRPMDLRYVNPPDALPGEPVLENQRVWARIDERLPDDWPTHFAGLAYLADSTLVDSVVLPHGQRWHDPRLNGASLDHAMWFHGRVRADEWLLLDQSVEATGDGLGLAAGRFFDRSGALVATCTQQGLIRWG